MTPEQFERVKRLFDAVVELPDAERPAFLERECPDDPLVRAEVERLLARRSGGGRLEELETVVDDALRTEPPVIDPERYRGLELIGEGGMGEVWRAEQQEPVRRTVALKLIKLGMDTRDVVARFETERQALALMSHPGIAQVFDAGATPEGRPYFVMEYVPGVPITEFCDEQALSTPERLELFREVCDAVQHAHQKGVIHRDLKPSNVLVALRDGKPVAKVIDFGVAKATQQRLTEATLFTQLGQLVGTPAYMSPEQATASAVDVDTRTDVYSLGVMLYELLVGVLPFDEASLRRAGYDEIRRVIREQDPPTPSTRLTDLGEQSGRIAEKRRTDVGQLRRQLRGDLDWVVMKALEKERARRYGSASELAADIARHLGDEPVVARPPSRAYKLRKFSRRNKVLVGGIAATFLALFAGVTVATVLAVREASARRAEERARTDLEQVADFQSEILRRADPRATGVDLFRDLRERLEEAERKRGASEEERAEVLAGLENALVRINATDVARELIDRAILAPAGESLQEQFADQPAIEARLRVAGGVTYRSLGLREEAEIQLRRAVELWTRERGERHPSTLSAKRELAIVHLNQGRLEEAEELMDEIVAARRECCGDEDLATLGALDDLCWLYHEQARPAKAEKIGRQVLEARRRLYGEDSPALYQTLDYLGLSLLGQGRFDEAVEMDREAVDGYRRLRGTDNSGYRAAQSNLALALARASRPAEAEEQYRALLAAQVESLGDEHPATIGTLLNLAMTVKSQGRVREAEEIYTDARDRSIRAQGRRHPTTLMIMHNLASIWKRSGRRDEALELTSEVYRTKRDVFGPEHPTTLNSLGALGSAYRDVGDFDRAIELHREVLEARTRVQGAGHPATLNAMQQLAVSLRSHDPAEALGLLERAYARSREALGEDHRRTLSFGNSLAISVARESRFDEAARIYEDVLERRRRVLGEDHPDTIWTMNNLANALGRLERFAEAESLHGMVLNARREVYGEEHELTLDTMYNLANLAGRRGDAAEAERRHREVLEISRKMLGPEHRKTLSSLHAVAEWLSKQERYAEAVEISQQALDLRRRVLGPQHERTVESASQVAECRWRTGDAERAIETLESAVRELPSGHQFRARLERQLADYRAGEGES